MLSRLRGGRSSLTRHLLNGQPQQQNPLFGASVIPSSSSLISPSFFNNSGDDDNEKNSHLLQKQQQYQYRLYHSTFKREIVPVVAAAGVVFVIGRYSWKALNRMDVEWEDYQWELQQYERQRIKEEDAANIPTTIGVDFGSLYLKLSKLANNNQPEIIPTAQGDRYRFTGLLMTDDNDDGSGGIITGKPALDKFFYQPSMDEDDEDPVDESVILPYRELQKSSHDDVAKLVQKIFVPAVGEAMERLAPSAGDNNNNNQSNNGIIRTVLTLPPTFYNQHGETVFQNYHDDKHHTITVPDPVATIWGAQNLKLIPEPESKEESASTSILVMDVGGLSTTISLVKQDKVVSSTTLDGIGGENFVQQLVNKVFSDIGDVNLSRDPMCLELVNQNVRGSALELINKNSTTVHIPYLFMGRKPNEPHFETTVSRNLMEQIVVDYWVKHTIPKLQEKTDALSSSLPPPTNASSLFTSAITKVLEDSEDTLPNDIKHFLIVGGGSRHNLFERACREGIETLIGPTSTKPGGKMVIPDPAVRAELPSLGAAALLPNFDYSYDRGLERA